MEPKSTPHKYSIKPTTIIQLGYLIALTISVIHNIYFPTPRHNLRRGIDYGGRDPLITAVHSFFLFLNLIAIETIVFTVLYRKIFKKIFLALFPGYIILFIAFICMCITNFHL
jgi:hypothetical protein